MPQHHTTKYQVELLNFEGPLDLLLLLIEQSKLEITEISLTDITQQYLHYLDKLVDLDPAELHQFIDLAAKLVNIKSQALLPNFETDSEPDDLHELAEQLINYRQYQKAGAYLEALLKHGDPSWDRQVVQPPPNLALLPLTPIRSDQLKAVFDAAISRLPNTPRNTITSQVTLTEMSSRILTSIKKQTSLPLSALLAGLESRLDALVMFLALLELLRRHQIRVSQNRAFGDIIVTNG